MKVFVVGIPSLFALWVGLLAWPYSLLAGEQVDASGSKTNGPESSWWAYQPLEKVQPPESEEAPPHWRIHPIDRFIYARLRENGLQPNPPSDPAAYIRRASYDLIGLPPTPEEVEEFKRAWARDSDAAVGQLIDRLLASPQYGERWGRHWLDVARFGESNGFERNVLINNVWPFRDYVIRSFNEDKPFDQFILEQLAGDVIDNGNPEMAMGTGFLVCGPYDNVGNQDPVAAAQIRANTIDEMIRAASEAFLATTIGCARCHDHKFDPVQTKDYYNWYATFAGVHHGDRVLAMAAARKERERKIAPLEEEKQALNSKRQALEKEIRDRAEEQSERLISIWKRPPVDRYGTEERFDPVPAKFVRLTVLSRDDKPEMSNNFTLEEFEIWTAESPARNVALLENGGRAEGASRKAKDFMDAYTPRLAIDGKFGARWLAAGSELMIELAKTEKIDRIFFCSDKGRVLNRNHFETRFVADYRLEISLDGEQWTEVANSLDRQPVNSAHREHRLFNETITPEEKDRLIKIQEQIADLNQKLDEVEELPRWWAGRFEPAPGPFHIFRGGDPQRKGEAVVPASLRVFDGTVPEYQLSAGTKESERRLALARWMVSPQNPLTPRVLANRLWHYHFGQGLVNTPSDFGKMGGQPSHPELLEWLARQVHASGWRLKPLHRLVMTSHTYRQSADHGQESAQKDANARWLWRFPPRRLSAEEIRDTFLVLAQKLDSRMGGPGFRLYEYQEDNVATYKPLDEHGPETYRRAVYHQNARAAQVDLLTDFDCPDPAFAAPRRDSTTTPLQALTLLNHDFSLDMARFFAQRLRREVNGNISGQIERAFQLAYFRDPTPPELERCLEFVHKHGLDSLCRVVLNSNELIYLH